jgi:hypothetical protein
MSKNCKHGDASVLDLNLSQAIETFLVSILEET